ncbi:MAG: ABC transporter ATP-binding protein [Anaerolineae bacterium]|nr:ABC transporter ATP-binding protein [Anaerolineae bacterium]
MQNVLLEVKDLHVNFFLTEGTVRAVNGVSFEIERGKTLGVVGESGCGKSVTARAILNMVRPPGRILSGEINYYGYSDAPVNLIALDPEGSEIRRIRWGEIAMIFQEPMTSLSPVHTIGNQMTEAICLHLNMPKDEALRYSIELLERVGLPQPGRLLNHYRHELSGGMRQRVMIAMALSCKPKLLIADEPTTAVDVTTQAQVLNLMRDLQQEFGMAILYITHDLGVVAEMADKVVVMYLGEEVEGADVDTIYYNPAHPYTRALLRSIPRHDIRLDRLETIEGNVPDPTNIPKGCAFHPRCHYYVPAQCVHPPYQQIGDGHWVRCTRAHEIGQQSSQTEQVL